MHTCIQLIVHKFIAPLYSVCCSQQMWHTWTYIAPLLHKSHAPSLETVDFTQPTYLYMAFLLEERCFCSESVLGIVVYSGPGLMVKIDFDDSNIFIIVCIFTGMVVITLLLFITGLISAVTVSHSTSESKLTLPTTTAPVMIDEEQIIKQRCMSELWSCFNTFAARTVCINLVFGIT